MADSDGRWKRQKGIPIKVNNHLGDGKLEKGRWGKIYLLAWDFAHTCAYEDCPLYEICEYVKTKQMDREKVGGTYYTNKCMLQGRYLKSVIRAVIQKVDAEKDVTEEGVLRLGYHILPLYAQLFKFKMWEYGNHELIYISEKGTPKVHPVYKEIREIVKTIESVWSKFNGPGKKNKKSAGEIGDLAYVDAMFHEMGEEAAQKAASTMVSKDENEDGEAIDFDKIEDNLYGDQKPQRVKRKRKKKKKKKRKKKVSEYQKKKEEARQELRRKKLKMIGKEYLIGEDEEE